MVYNTTQHLPPTQPNTVCICITLGRGGGGAWEVREKVEGQQLTRGVENTTRLTVSPVYKLYLNTSNDDI
jgi:hypothetical protein